MPLAPVQVISIRSAGRAPVYCLSVPRSGVLLVGRSGLVVRNCDACSMAVRVATDLAHHPADGTYQEPEPERARGALGITRERLADRGRPLAPRRRRW